VLVQLRWCWRELRESNGHGRELRGSKRNIENVRPWTKSAKSQGENVPELMLNVLEHIKQLPPVLILILLLIANPSKFIPACLCTPTIHPIEATVAD